MNFSAEQILQIEMLMNLLACSIEYGQLQYVYLSATKSFEFRSKQHSSIRFPVFHFTCCKSYGFRYFVIAIFFFIYSFIFWLLL